MRIVRTALVATLVGAALAITGALPASAHDDLVASDPTDGQRLATAPDLVTLTFSAKVLTIGAAVVVIDEFGHNWVTGEPEIDDGTVRAAVEPGMPDAGYEVRWQVVSRDGHPISGLIPFTVGDGVPLVRETAPASESDPLTVQDSQRSAGGPSPWRLVLVGALGAAAAVGLFATIQFLRRRSRDGTSDPRQP